jgi:hypothetical protein
MPIQLHEENGGKMFAVQISGILAKADYQHFVPAFGRLVQQHAKLRVLFDLTSFDGWNATGLWDDIKFNHKHSANLERLAMVGDKKWRHGMATFCKSFANATTRHFSHAGGTKAREWLSEA